MKKYEKMSVSDFLNRGGSTTTSIDRWKRHFEKYGFVYKVIGTTVIILVTGGGVDYAFASNGIDRAAGKLYKELVNIGRWILVFKGGVDVIKAVGDGDFPTAKRQFFQYLLIYLMLLGLPYGMEKVDDIFNELAKA